MLKPLQQLLSVPIPKLFLSNLLKFPEAPEDFKLDAESNKHRILQPRPAAFYHLCSMKNFRITVTNTNTNTDTNTDTNTGTNTDTNTVQIHIQIQIQIFCCRGEKIKCFTSQVAEAKQSHQFPATLLPWIQIQPISEI